MRKVDKDKVVNLEVQFIRERIRDVNAIQTVNAIFQYCPQFLFQSFLIVYRRYKCVITGKFGCSSIRLKLIKQNLLPGVSAGLAGFSFLWHVFIHFYYWIKRYNEDLSFDPNGSTRIIDNLSTSLNEHSRTIAHVRGGSAGSSIISNNMSHATASSLSENLKNFEKPMYKTDDKNLMSKKQGPKNVEKSKIFGFNKRKPIYEQEDFDLYESNNISTVFFELDESATSSKFHDASRASNKELDNFINENSANLNISKCFKFNADKSCTTDDDPKGVAVICENRNSMLKRKGICSSQEMLHLVDIMNDNISPEQVDVLAKSLVEFGGDESLQTESEHDDLDNSKLLEQFPDTIDDKLLENIDAAIYENQIIFQERIRKNQLTIQNLKLQDQMLSKCMNIGDLKSLPTCTELLSIRDYENMCFTNISRQNRGMKHWRNYLNDIDTNNHDNSTVQHSSYYVNTNTMSNSITTTDDLYINETEAGSTLVDEKGSDKMDSGTFGAVGGVIPHKKAVRWHSKLEIDESLSDDLYITMGEPGALCRDEEGACALPQTNMLVETINKINVDSPIKNLLGSVKSASINQSIDTFIVDKI